MGINPLFECAVDVDRTKECAKTVYSRNPDPVRRLIEPVDGGGSCRAHPVRENDPGLAITVGILDYVINYVIATINRAWRIPREVDGVHSG
jgi:hypothetical protein